MPKAKNQLKWVKITSLSTITYQDQSESYLIVKYYKETTIITDLQAVIA